jgi:acyl-CoA thioesterase YciA
LPCRSDKELVLKVIPMPADCNANGDIFGGWVMAQVDLAGSVVPARHVQGRMATVAVNQFIFKHPVRVGDILSFFASVTRVGTHLHHRAGGGVCRALPHPGRST